jgi:hypothetical protein
MRVLIGCLVALSGLAWAEGPSGGVPQGWFYAGAHPGFFESGAGQGACNERSVLLRSVTPDGGAPPVASDDTHAPNGTVMQVFRADKYRGKRVRFSGLTTTSAVRGWAGLWMRVDAEAKRTIAFDNMLPRALRGDTPCERNSVVLDVGPDAEFIALGIVLEGAGAVELSDIGFEVVDQTVASTDLVHLPADPRDDAARGRVGRVWFSDRIVNDPGSLGALKRSTDGWSLAGGDSTARLVDGRIELHLPPNAGVFSVRREGTTTVIEGDWGTTLASYPVTIRYDRSRVDMTWGFYQRHLLQEFAPQLAPGCVYYSERNGTAQADQLELCGAVFEKPLPPRVQTVAAFLMQGFRRQNTNEFRAGRPPADPPPQVIRGAPPTGAFP